MEIVDCCNMGLKLRAELEVRLTTLAMLAESRCLDDTFSHCDPLWGCRAAESKGERALKSTYRMTDMLAPFQCPRTKLRAHQWLCRCSTSITAGTLPSSASAGCASDFLMMTESLQTQTFQIVSRPKLQDAWR